MKKVLSIFTAMLLISIGVAGVSQNNGVAINTTGVAPDASAMLDVVSTSKGVLIPRMSIAERNAIASPANGLQVYNIDCNALNIWNGTCWISTGAISDPLPITSNSASVLCSNSTATYSIPAVVGATGYNWTVPAGVVINSGQGTNAINITWGNYSGQVCVKAYSACETSKATCMNVNIISPIVASAGANLQYYSSSCSAVTIGGSPTASGGEGIYTYSWSPSAALSSTTLANPTANPSATTTYTVTVTSGGCVATSSMTMTVATGGTQTFYYTGTPQTWIVPVGITCINITAAGASGGLGYYNSGPMASGGLGGTVSGIKLVTPGTILTINVGQQGGNATATTAGVGGINGGGNGGFYNATYSGGGGGGASDVMLGGASPSNRIIVGGGGGGGGVYYSSSTGGNGGYPFGGNGLNGGSYSSYSGAGGTLFSGGSGAGSGPGIPGGFGYGGNAYASGTSGGGGGGYYGGGGGGSSTSSNSAGGGGGSSYIGGMSSNTSFINGNNSGNGQVTISW